MPDKNLIVGIMGAIALIMLDRYLSSKRSYNNLIPDWLQSSSKKTTLQIEDLYPEPDPTDLTAHLVYCLAPWGKVIPIFFSPDQWQMLNQLAKMSGQDIEEVICEVATERYEIVSRLYPPEESI